MASPQVENGCTSIANEIVEALMKVNLSPSESRVLWFLFRKTYGWKKKTDWLSLSQFSKETGLDRRNVHRALKKLSSKQMIVIYKDDTFRIRYGFQKNYEKWKLSSKQTTVVSLVPQLSSKQTPTKESITKEDINISSVIRCPHKEIIKLYHDILPELRSVQIWNEKRKRKLLKSWKQEKKRQDLSWWEGYFKYIRESKFLMGDNPRGWMPNLEWLVTPNHLLDVAEGKYHT